MQQTDGEMATQTSWLERVLAALRPYANPKLQIILLLGFSSGLPIMLTYSTLSAWLGDVGVDKTTIGLFAAVGIAYSFNYLWAPLVDHVRLPLLNRLGRRRGWILFCQLVLLAAIAAMGATNPLEHPELTALFAVCVAFASATQDIVIDAYRTEILETKQFGEGAAVGVFGYRIAMLVAGAGALLFADMFNWHVSYLIMACCMGVGMLAVLFAKEPVPPAPEEEDKSEDILLAVGHKLQHALIDPFRNFMQRKGWWLLLLFVLCAKFSDAFAGFMINPFLLEIGFTKTQLAEIGKVYGFIATTVGTIIGAVFIRRLGVMKSLWVCILFQMSANLVYIVQAKVGADVQMLMLTITADNLSAGMAISALIAFMMSLCNLRYTATQYALLSSLAGFGRTVLAVPSGWVVDTFDWTVFFLASGALGIPALIALYFVPRFVDVNELEKARQHNKKAA